MISPKIWRDQLGLGWDDNLCIACIEKRLGRKLKGPIPDFCTWASVEGFPPSDTLIDRWGLNELKRYPRRRRDQIGRTA